MEDNLNGRVGVDLALIHQCISRAIHVSKLYSNIFRQCGFPDGKIRPGFGDYVHSLLSVLLTHHQGEDELAFPVFRDKLPEAPYERLAADHHFILQLLREVRLKIDEALDNESSQEPLSRLDGVMTELGDIWSRHIEIEEFHFSPDKLDAVMSPEDQARLVGRLAQFFLLHSGPDYLIVPFTLFNLPPESRMVLSGTMPPLVTRELVTGPWKDKWRPMSPFLLV